MQVRGKAVRPIQAIKLEPLIRKHRPKTAKFSYVYIMNGRNHELPKGSEIRCSGKRAFPAPHVAPVTISIYLYINKCLLILFYIIWRFIL